MTSDTRSPSQLLIVCFIFSLLLSGCVTSQQKFQDKMKAQGINPLASPEIRKLFSDATMFSSSGMGEYRGYYTKDGKIEVEDWWIRAESIDRGKWEASEDGLLCQYFGVWTEEERCYSVYPSKTEEEFTLVQMSGPFSEYVPDGILPSRITRGR